jgi:hypothetical protein
MRQGVLGFEGTVKRSRSVEIVKKKKSRRGGKGEEKGWDR